MIVEVFCGRVRLFEAHERVFGRVRTFYSPRSRRALQALADGVVVERSLEASKL